MKKFSRRELFRGAGTAAVGGTALAVGLSPGKTAYEAAEFKTLLIEAGSRVDLAQIFGPTNTVTIGYPVRKWFEIFNEDVRLSGLGPEYEMSVEKDEE